jgi:thiamine-phosphate diphosphorylase
LLINDDIELAALVGADGVHLGREDGAVTQARKQLGSDAIIGVSCYNFVEQAIAAQAQGATYAAFGRFSRPRQNRWQRLPRSKRYGKPNVR